MKWWKKTLDDVFGRDVVCPLCGSREVVATKGMIPYSQIRQRLVKLSEWMQAHAVEGSLADIPQQLKDRMGDPLLPDIEVTEDEDSSEDRRCKSCRSLLPRQFWLRGPAERLALTVAGAAGNGKTTWLMSVLTPPRTARYAIIGYSEELLTRAYDYAEPYTIDMLDAEFRTGVNYLLMGCTIRHPDGQVDVRTLDIRGELFTTALPDASKRIERHLSSGGGGGLLVVERYTTDMKERLATDIARAYMNMIEPIRTKMRGAPLWKGVVWTWLDKAEWSDAGKTWLRTHLQGPEADAFVVVGEATITLPLAPELVRAYEQIVVADHAALRQLCTTIEKPEAISEAEVGALCALLFRLQLLYAAYVGHRPINRLDYYDRGGWTYVQACQRFAKQLYIRWDLPRGGMSGLLTNAGKNEDNEWRVLACGRIEEPGRAPESIWSDQIILNIVGDLGRV